MARRSTRIFLTVGDAARRAGLSPDGIRAAERRGDLPAIRTTTDVRLFDERDVIRFIERRRQEAADSVLQSGDAA